MKSNLTKILHFSEKRSESLFRSVTLRLISWLGGWWEDLAVDGTPERIKNKIHGFHQGEVQPTYHSDWFCQFLPVFAKQIGHSSEFKFKFTQ